MATEYKGRETIMTNLVNYIITTFAIGGLLWYLQMVWYLGHISVPMAVGASTAFFLVGVIACFTFPEDEE